MICHFFQLFFSLIFLFSSPLRRNLFFFFLSIYCMKIKKHTTRSIVENYWLVIFCFCFVLRRVFVRIGERLLMHSSVLGQDCRLQGGLFRVRGHSTTTWTSRGGGGVSKKSTLVHPGGGDLRMSTWTRILKKVQKNHGQ